MEHPAVYECCKRLERSGWRVTFLTPDENGVIRPPDVERAVCEDTALISIMYANNETGVLQPVKDIGEIAASHHIPFHSDAVQALDRKSVV